MARTVQKRAKRTTKSKVAVPLSNAIRSQALVRSDRGDTRKTEAAGDRSAGPSDGPRNELEDWLAAKKEFDRLLKGL